MFKGVESEAIYDNQKIEYRIVTNYEDAYRYNSPRGKSAPKAEIFMDINEKNYKSESTKRERQDKAIRNRSNRKNNHKDSSDETKTIGAIIIAIIFFVLKLIF
ncbi:hypothetical protein H7E67_03560 [Clostridium gasigenes]|uniref:hypothetical protein n=1 Tax=Clostridium gasigenes TaxID=94869 RepID=UPI0014383CB9|nr:hypothetical protein [Clostridium gasigenes]MBB6622500.1 hypothetical protein [Clostridium gasigenes]MBU3130919.1 hypothetical protein [Clostridium gasigenes]NKF07201.1 hypothetical protein [Clostridium gasigenes]QSW18183.1 hypothetical protein J1C67_11450 [Clostridium gasigenes]